VEEQAGQQHTDDDAKSLMQHLGGWDAELKQKGGRTLPPFLRRLAEPFA